MKNLFLLLIGTFLLASCTKEAPVKTPSFDAEKFVHDHQQKVDQAAKQFADAGDGNLIFTEADFTEICRLENEVLNVFTDEELRACMPVGKRNLLAYDYKLWYLREKLNGQGRISEGGTVETFAIRQNGPAVTDANADVLAQVIAASGTTVGINSSLNLWRPINDPGTVTNFDVTRALLSIQQSTSFDTFVEYVPESVVFEFQVSGGNWLIAADIITTNPAGISNTIHYGNDSPNGPLIWNPTLNSPGDDDLIQGPLPSGVLSIAANGLTPPAPLD